MHLYIASHLSCIPASACLFHWKERMCQPGPPHWSQTPQSAAHIVNGSDLAEIVTFYFISKKHMSTCLLDSHRTPVWSSNVWCTSSSNCFAKSLLLVSYSLIKFTILTTVERVVLMSSQSYLPAKVWRCSIQWKTVHSWTFSFKHVLKPLSLLQPCPCSRWPSFPMGDCDMKNRNPQL